MLCSLPCQRRLACKHFQIETFKTWSMFPKGLNPPAFDRKQAPTHVCTHTWSFVFSLFETFKLKVKLVTLACSLSTVTKIRWTVADGCRDQLRIVTYVSKFS